MSNKNWRAINNNMIQTHAVEVFLWDNQEGVAVRCPVPSRPWKGINESFVAWMAATDWKEGNFPSAPLGIIDKVKIAYDDGSTFEADKDIFFSIGI